jgi:hypothetical protein
MLSNAPGSRHSGGTGAAKGRQHRRLGVNIQAKQSLMRKIQTTTQEMLSRFTLPDKVVVITGGGNGIERVTSHHLRRGGAISCIIDSDDWSAKQAAEFLFLAAPASAMITGAMLPVDGGFLAPMTPYRNLQKMLGE